MLGATEADPFGAELARPARIRRNVGVRPHAQPAPRIRPRHQLVEFLADLRCDELGGAEDHPAGRAVDGDHLAAFDGAPVYSEPAGGGIDIQLFRADDARLAHAARDDRRMACHPTSSGQDGARRDDPVEVFG